MSIVTMRKVAELKLAANTVLATRPLLPCGLCYEFVDILRHRRIVYCGDWVYRYMRFAGAYFGKYGYPQLGNWTMERELGLMLICELSVKELYQIIKAGENNESMAQRSN